MREAGKNQKSLDPIPVDILFEIFLRLPSKSVTRFVCVSKLWTTIIQGRDFIKSYSLRSSPKKQPRFLFAFNKETKGYEENWYFFSKLTHSSSPLSPVLDLKKALVVKEPPDFVSSMVCHLQKLRCRKPSYVHGLICFLYGEEQIVCNPSTGKSITLPPIVLKSTEMIIKSFLGYDPIHAEYKVLSLTNVTRFCDHHVLTLGPRAQDCCSWRTIQCTILPHYPGTEHVCLDGVLYYSASTSHTTDESLLVGFDLKSENLEMASVFPKAFGSFSEISLINYHGKVALVTQANGELYLFYLWVLHDANKQEWSKEHLCFHTGVTESRNHRLEILGTSDMGEIIFTRRNFEELVVYFLDHNSNRVRSVVLEGTPKHKFREFYRVFTFLRYVESVMFI